MATVEIDAYVPLSVVVCSSLSDLVHLRLVGPATLIEVALCRTSLTVSYLTVVEIDFELAETGPAIIGQSSTDRGFEDVWTVDERFESRFVDVQIRRPMVRFDGRALSVWWAEPVELFSSDTNLVLLVGPEKLIAGFSVDGIDPNQYALFLRSTGF